MSRLRQRATVRSAVSCLRLRSPADARAWLCSEISCDSDPELNAFSSQPCATGARNRPPADDSARASASTAARRRDARSGPRRMWTMGGRMPWSWSRRVVDVERRPAGTGPVATVGTRNAPICRAMVPTGADLRYQPRGQARRRGIMGRPGGPEGHGSREPDGPPLPAPAGPSYAARDPVGRGSPEPEDRRMTTAEPAAAPDVAELRIGEQTLSLPIERAVDGQDAINIGTLLKRRPGDGPRLRLREHRLRPAARSRILDGDAGVLRYRGLPDRAARRAVDVPRDGLPADLRRAADRPRSWPTGPR